MLFMTGANARSKYETRYTVSSNITTGANAFALMGSPSAVGTYRFVIATGVTLSSSSTATPGLTVGNFPAGSTVIIENNGTIKGRGGAGGAGSAVGTGGTGGAGGPAVSISSGYAVRIDNTLGNIWGGGGGQGGQGVGSQGYFTGDYCAALSIAGSVGGAGAGPNSATGGGDYGQAGPTGLAGSATSTGGCPPGGVSGGGAGGAAGKAIALNGNTVTWLGGNNSTQVKGAVS